MKILSMETPAMNRIAFVVFALTVLASGRLMLTAQETAKPAVFTSAQAEAGRTVYASSCGKCHTYSLLGRSGQEGELPTRDRGTPSL